MALISVTRLHLRSWRFFPSFLAYTMLSSRQAKRSPGFVAGVLAGDDERGNWTITVWRDEAAMRAFRSSGVHLKAMPYLMRWCDEAAVMHWTDNDAALPSMEMSFERLRKDGRLSKVNHPSSRQARGERTGARPPRVGLTLK